MAFILPTIAIKIFCKQKYKINTNKFFLKKNILTFSTNFTSSLTRRWAVSARSTVHSTTGTGTEDLTLIGSSSAQTIGLLEIEGQERILSFTNLCLGQQYYPDPSTCFYFTSSHDIAYIILEKV